MLTLQLNQEQTNKGTNEIDARHAGHSDAITTQFAAIECEQAPGDWFNSACPWLKLRSALCVCVCLSCFALVYECVSTLDLIKEPVIRPHSRKATTTTRLLTGLPSTRSLASGILLVHTQLIFSFLSFSLVLSLSLSLSFSCSSPLLFHPSILCSRPQSTKRTARM